MATKTVAGRPAAVGDSPAPTTRSTTDLGRVTTLAQELRTSLSGLPGVTVRDLGRQLCGIVSFTMEGWDAETLKEELRKRRINVSVTSRSSTRIDMEDRDLNSMVRASVHYYNVSEEIDSFVGALEEISPRGDR